ncbi:MAG: DUF4340 domain-containing protein [Verrucomicrobiales bacterium]|nr:DUF4340 domain-containing protein [Verrucomicrobiales bacterium]
MKITTTAVLAGISLILALAISWVNRNPPGGDGSGAGNVLTRFEAAVIDQVVVRRPAGDVKMEKVSGFWFFTEPIRDRIDPNAAAALLDQLNHLSILDEIERSEIGGENEISAADMGLDSGNVIRVELSKKSTEEGVEEPELTEVVLIGGAAPMSNAVYARVPNSEERQEVYVVDGNPRAYLADPVKSLRDPRLSGSPPDRLVKVVVNTARGNIQIQRTIQPPLIDWTITKPLQTRANKKVLEELVSGLGSIVIIDVMEDGIEPTIPNPVPDDSLAFELTYFGSEEPVRLFLTPQYEDGKMSEDLLEAVISDRPARYLVRSDLLNKLPQSPNEFRDLHLNKVPPMLLESITIQSRTEPQIRLRSTPTQNGLQWDALVNERWQPANQAAVSRLVSAVNDTEVLDFVSDSAALLPEHGLEPPALQVIFRIRPPEGMEISPEHEDKLNRILRIGRREDDEVRVFANILGEPYIYEVPPDLPQAIPVNIANWKSLKLMSFNAFHLKEIKRIRPGEPTVSLEYDFKKDTWEGKQGGKDITGRIDKKVAGRIRETLGSLSAAGWQVNLTGPYQKLQTPSLIYQITVSEFDPAVGETRDIEHTLKFAPSTSDLFYYGQKDDSPDVFRIDRKTYSDLIRPLTVTKLSPPG